MLTNIASRVAQRVSLKEIQDSTILVTGASGLLGINLAHAFSDSSHGKNLHLIGNTFPNYLLEGSLKNAKIYRRDLLEDNALEDIPVCDLVIHAATYAQPVKFMENQLQTSILNTSVTFQLMEKLKPGGTFVYLSSSEVYGSSDTDVFTENSTITLDPKNPRSVYITSKLSGEAIVRSSSELLDLVGINFRISSVFGPGVKKGDHRVMSQLIEQALVNQEIHLIDNGLARRTFCYIEDAIVLISGAISRKKSDTLNIAGQDEVSILELAHLIGETLNVPVTSKIGGSPMPGSPSRVRVSSEKAIQEMSEFGYRSFKSSIEDTINWHKLIT
jgi:UDP-glucuronate decarboxylase